MLLCQICLTYFLPHWTPNTVSISVSMFSDYSCDDTKGKQKRLRSDPIEANKYSIQNLTALHLIYFSLDGESAHSTFVRRKSCLSMLVSSTVFLRPFLAFLNFELFPDEQWPNLSVYFPPFPSPVEHSSDRADFHWLPWFEEEVNIGLLSSWVLSRTCSAKLHPHRHGQESTWIGKRSRDLALLPSPSSA